MLTWWNDQPRERRSVVLLTAVAFAAVAASGLVVAKLIDDVFGGDDVTRIDPGITAFAVEHRTSGLTTLARSVTRLADAGVVATVVAAAALGLLWRRRQRLAGFLVLSAAGAAAVTSFGKLVVDRPRPDPALWLARASGAAFPSGHATQGVACWCALAICAAMLTRRRWLRVVALAAGPILAAAIGASRVYLGVHWASDVVCGWALASGWLLTLVLIGWSGPRFAPEIAMTRERARALRAELPRPSRRRPPTE